MFEKRIVDGYPDDSARGTEQQAKQLVLLFSSVDMDAGPSTAHRWAAQPARARFHSCGRLGRQGSAACDVPAETQLTGLALPGLHATGSALRRIGPISHHVRPRILSLCISNKNPDRASTRD
jgi:hypothetical protein